MRKIFIDEWCEIFDLIAPLADQAFWQLDQAPCQNNAIYVVGRNEFLRCRQYIDTILSETNSIVIFSNPAEASETMWGQFGRYNLWPLMSSPRFGIISGGEFDSRVKNFWLDNFAYKMLMFDENLDAMKAIDEIFDKHHKPYKFLYLNGRMRAHRSWMIKKLRNDNLLDQGLWTNLDSSPVPASNLQFVVDNKNIINDVEAVQYLPKQYEHERYKNRIGITTVDPNVKTTLFNSEWGEAYIYPAPYIDTYFSLVSETVATKDYSFRTEKFWKPIILGHPWVVIANKGFLRDLRNLGFRTFANIFDESFDMVDDDQKRLEMIADVVKDLCHSNLQQFLETCKEICYYNQQHVIEFNKQNKKDVLLKFALFLMSFDE